MVLTDELAEVEFTLFAHVRGARVAEVGIVRPDYDFRDLPAISQMGEQRIQCFRHVLVTDVPSGDAALEHRAVIALRIVGKKGVLLRVEKLVGGG